VRSFEGTDDLFSDRESFREGDFSFNDAVCQRGTFDDLHDEIIIGAHIKESANIGMTQCRDAIGE